MVLFRRVQVSLRLDKKSVPVKVAFSRNVVTEMTGNPHFGAGTPINPPLAEVSTASDELETAYINAQNGGTEQTAIQDEKEIVLDGLLVRLGHYVEDVANQTPEMAESIILSAGMDVRKTRAPISMTQAQNLRADYGDSEGQIALNCDPVKGAQCYLWLFSPTPDGSTPFRLKDRYMSVTTRSDYLWEGLDPGQEYAFKVIPVGAEGLGPASDVVVHRAS